MASLESLWELQDMANHISEVLCREDLYPCKQKQDNDISCMVKIKEAGQDKMSLSGAATGVELCPSCTAYWLSLRLTEALLSMR